MVDCCLRTTASARQVSAARYGMRRAKRLADRAPLTEAVPGTIKNLWPERPVGISSAMIEKLSRDVPVQCIQRRPRQEVWL